MIPKRKDVDDNGAQFADKLPRSLGDGNRVLYPARMVLREERSLELGLGNRRNDGLGTSRLEARGERGRRFVEFNTAQHETRALAWQWRSNAVATRVAPKSPNASQQSATSFP